MKRILLLVSITSACILYDGDLFASEQQIMSNNHKEHEIKSGTLLPIYFIATQNLLTIYFEAAIGEVYLTIVDKNNEIVYTKQLYIGEPMSLPIELDTPAKEYTVYINKL